MADSKYRLLTVHSSRPVHACRATYGGLNPPEPELAATAATNIQGPRVLNRVRARRPGRGDGDDGDGTVAQ